MHSPPSSTVTPSIASLPLLAALGAGVFALSLLSLELTRLEAGVALVWLGNGLAVGLLLSWPGRIAPGAWVVLAGAMAVARATAGDELARIVLMSALNLAEVVLIVGAFRRFGRPLSERQSLLRNAAVGAVSSVLACGLVALAASLGLGLIGQRPLAFAPTLLVVFSAHLLGMVTTASVVTMLIGQHGSLLGRRGERRAFVLSWLLLMAVLCAVLAQTTYPLLFLPLLPLAWLAYRHGVPGAVLGVLSTAVAVGGASILRLGPFQLVSADQPFAHSLLPQIYVLSACVLALPLGLLVADRRGLLRRLRRSEARYRLLAEHTRDLVVRLRSDGSRSYVSEAARSLLGYAPDELAAPRRDLFHPEDDPDMRATLEPLFAEPGNASIQFRMRHRDGHWVWLEALVVSVPAECGSGYDVVYSARDISARIAAEQALLEQARTDTLTGLPNRREFNERLLRALQRGYRSGLAIGVFMMDLDHFKAINDELGHAAGDEALREFAARLRPQLREADVLARLGGDEFAMLMENLTSVAECEAAAHRFLSGMRSPFHVSGVERSVGVSIGIAFGQGLLEADALLAAADAALYRVKQSGRGRYEIVQVQRSSAP